MEFIISTRGSKKLCYEGHAYTFKAKNKVSQRWECSLRRACDCRSILTTDLTLMEVRSVGDHSHEGSQSNIDAMKAKQDIKTAMKDGRGTTSQVVVDKLSKYSKETIVAAGSMESLKRTARRHKQSARAKEPTARKDIPAPLPDPYQTHLIYDNESKDNRVLVYASDSGLRLLCSSDTWFMDGTHSTAPSQFQQIFCTRATIGDSFASVVYALLPSKTQQIYEECMTAILDACLQKRLRPGPTTVVVDYELAIHQALKTTLSPDIHIQGCFYHLTQSTWRRVQAEGLQSLYNECENARHFCGMLDGLAFLPLQDIPAGMEYLRSIVPNSLTSLVEYFDCNYVTGPRRIVLTPTGTIRFRRTKPPFSPETWNVHDATLAGTARTNNICEGSNNGFRNLVGHTNPSLWTVIDCLQKDAAMVEADIIRFEQGLLVGCKPRRGAVAHQKKLVTLCKQYIRKD